MANSELLRWGMIIGIPIFVFLFYKFILRVFFGLVIVPEDKIGLVTKKFVLFGKQQFPKAVSSLRAAKQASRHKHFHRECISGNGYGNIKSRFQPFIVIPTGKIGLVLAKDGAELETGAILGRKVNCDSFQDAVAFLKNGGRKGRQTDMITPGSLPYQYSFV